MYKFERYRQLGLADFNQPVGLKMNPEDPWVKKAETISWDAEYSRPRKPRFRNFGNRRSGGRKPIDWLDYHVLGIVVLSSP